MHVPDGADVDVVEVDRGGKSTYHAPGQLVCYPILDLTRHGQDVKRYCRDLEEALIRTTERVRLDGDADRRADRRLARVAAAEDRVDRHPPHEVDLDARLRAERRPRPGAVHATGSPRAGSTATRSRRWRASSAGRSRSTTSARPPRRRSPTCFGFAFEQRRRRLTRASPRRSRASARTREPRSARCDERLASVARVWDACLIATRRGGMPRAARRDVRRRSADSLGRRRRRPLRPRPRLVRQPLQAVEQRVRRRRRRRSRPRSASRTKPSSVAWRASAISGRQYPSTSSSPTGFACRPSCDQVSCSSSSSSVPKPPGSATNAVGELRHQRLPLVQRADDVQLASARRAPARGRRAPAG